MPFHHSKRWEVAPALPEEVDRELAALYPPFFRQLLYNRGILTLAEAERYLQGQVECDDPALMLGMAATVDRLAWAVEHGEKIVVYGDYDADGVTATALMVQVLEALGANVRPYIPSRFDEGYGLNLEAVELLAKEGARLVLTVDCGIRSFEEAERARQLGMDLIISDHHHPLQSLPDAFAIVCPRQEGETYPDRNLAGVGLAYKIAQALLARFPSSGLEAADWLDLVAVGTVADVASLLGENRMLVRRGIERLRQGRRPGLAALAGAARLNLPKLSTFDIGFGLGPRLNAAGRMDSAMSALELLLAKDSATAGRLAQVLDNHNIRRQEVMRDMQERAEAIALREGEEAILFAFQEDFSEGILGLAAARLTERYYRPAVVGKIEGEYARASCRSIPEFHITRALDECKDLLVRHGGHSMAAGLTLRTEHLDELRERLGQIAARELGTRELRPVIRADKELDASKIHRKYIDSLMKYLEQLQPTGQGNPEPVFVSRGLKVHSYRQVGSDKSHLKFSVSAGDVVFSAIAFRQGEWANHMPPSVDLMYQFEINYYNGEESLQLKVLDLRPAGSAPLEIGEPPIRGEAH